MTDVTAHPVDMFVGEKVRSRRKAMGISQSELARALGLTFQQVQKYERGANRISASKLYETAIFLKVPISYFFQGIDSHPITEGADAQTQAAAVTGFLSTEEGMELARDFPLIRSRNKRRRLLELCKVLSE